MQTKAIQNEQLRTSADYAIEHAERSLTRRENDAIEDAKRHITSIRAMLDAAERALDEGRTPNTCGVLQGVPGDLDRAVGRLDAIREIRKETKPLATAARALLDADG